MNGFLGRTLTAYLTKIELVLPNKHKNNGKMEVKHVPLTSGPHSSAVGELASFSQAFLFALELKRALGDILEQGWCRLR
jgi:hypothetical protein